MRLHERRLLIVDSWQKWCLTTLFSSSCSSPLYITTSRRHGTPRSIRQEGTARRMLDLKQYLTDTLHHIVDDDNNDINDFAIDLCESHRKLMIRGLLGKGKIDFDEQFHQAKLQLQWQRATELLDQLRGMPVSRDDAPYYHDVLSSDIENYRDLPPLKLFTKMAGGKTFQGKFERLLQQTNPELVSVYERTVLAEPPDLDVLRFLVAQSDQEPAIKEQMRQCLDLELEDGPAVQQAEIGLALGKQGELDLKAFLQKRLVKEQNNSKVGIAQSTIYSNLLVQPQGSRNNWKQQKGDAFIEVSAELLGTGMTNEFDAVLVETAKDSVTIRELWESKVSLNPLTIHDALAKKWGALKQILQHPDTRFYTTHDNCPLPIVPDLPRVGIFALDCLPPQLAARRVQRMFCEKQLANDPETVLRALATGGKLALSCGDEVTSVLQSTLQLVTELEPMVVVLSLPLLQDG